MKDISVFDIIGPNMIGPSSSHTAGALRIALLAGKMVKGGIVNVKFILYGSFAETYKGHGTDRALLAGIMGFNTEDYRIKNSFSIAEDRNLIYSFEVNKTNKDVHPNTVDIVITNDSGKTTTVRGESIGGGNILIKKVNGVEISLSGDYNTIVVKQQDTPGVAAHITKILSDHHINIAFMSIYREAKGEFAYTIIEVDEKVSQDVVAELESNSHIESAMLIEV
ncbi:L-serine ammonia-lyase, iron-sulfur-dependent subunit beta [Sinanaerobacter chloroacetimidivorans]|uniref:L-serine deaminase n=1 Tax=Sinanaerobacter chloroacetimidivorans TaxID=2818044 RepID=A0A8J7W3G6_9FIRM|nr:L-serine ammonia-lyase, iron-sulfur-dependent subunit beta [Sinanaerobacter chloroacetimidivorans]MBR0600194.1 L-serine ammonia-lyase, iron-sulfur-dependent subunit beta [Sinanaerobacter chloroacetimidivorans]